MPFRSASPASRHARRGVALVIVLAFVLLLTGLVLAFFSRALSERQISNSSASQVKVDALARGAMNTVIGDLQQEIAAGSTPFPLPSPIPAQGGATIFVPSVPATMVPAPVFPSPTPAVSPSNPSGLENLVKQSAGGQPFYPVANYNAANFKPSTRAAKSASGAGATGENSTNKPSLNGRFVSPARWNKPLLLPATSATDLTPVINGGTFVPPDWVLLARDGSNPATWNQTLTTSTNAATAVVGRYAYNIYDEGGLLDANLAGYPAPSSTPSPTNAGRAGAYKNTLAYADLTQLTDVGGNPLLTQVQIDALVGWRNGASTNAPSAFPSPAFTDASRDSYYQSLLSNPTGFLSIGNTMLSNNKQSDRMFSGRQTLISLIQSIGALTATDPTKPDATQLAKANAALRYLGTSGRSLEQPSYMPESTRPKVQAATGGGNNSGALNLEDAINPNFLTVRVASTTPGGRFDGSNLVAGEPLVKKRFDLNRLAWLTYLGPSADNMSSQIVQSTINALIGKRPGDNPPASGDPAYTAYQTALQFVKLGTKENIQKYFGLQWSTDHWSYNVHNRGGTNGAIRKLDGSKLSPPEVADVLHANREADFFELLKASINVGSIAKTSLDPNTTSFPGGASGSYRHQYDEDSSVDGAIMQLGANIIDQFDLDGYSTRIFYNDRDDGAASNAKDFYGIENLPYLSRLAHALVKVKKAVLTTSGAVTTITDTGVGALLQCPELWNPHDYNTANPDQINQTAGIVGPTKFRIFAISGNPPGLTGVNTQVAAMGYIRDQDGQLNAGHHYDQITAATPAAELASPGFKTAYHFNFSPGEQFALTPGNTELDFTITRDASGLARFREPTILCQLGPTGYVDQSPLPTSFGIIGQNGTFFSGRAFKSDVGSGISGVPPVQGQGYVGFYLGASPLIWADPQRSNKPLWLDEVGLAGPVVDVHYYLQYEYPADSGTYVNYDVKYRTLGGSAGISENGTLSGGGNRSVASNGWESFFYPGITAKQYNWDSSYAVMDPRTSRFGMVKLTAGDAAYPFWTYPPYRPDSTGATSTRPAPTGGVAFTNGWVDVTKGIGLSLRSGNNDGAPLICPVGLFPTAMGWNPGSVAVSTANARFAASDGATLGPISGNHVCHLGLFSQNNPFARRNNRAMGDSGDSDSMDGTFAPLGSSNAAQFYTDPDGVVRRASAGLLPYGSNGPAAMNDTGLPMAVANRNGVTRIDQSDSRPVVLNRPFRTVGELAYTFSGTPWKNLNFSMPESGDGALLDVFCVNGTDDANGLATGKVNLNTRQMPVLQAILAGAYKNEWNPATENIAGGVNSLAYQVAQTLVQRTTAGPKKGLNVGKLQPLSNVSDLVGRWVQNVSGDSANGVSGGASAPITNPRSYDGFSADLIDNRYSPAGEGILVTTSDKNATITRYTNATLRALSGNGQTRVWNLLIDVIAQTGRYPQSATSFDKFAVEGEQRFWVHVAIDRLTGQVIDKQIEVVKE